MDSKGSKPLAYPSSAAAMILKNVVLTAFGPAQDAKSHEKGSFPAVFE